MWNNRRFYGALAAVYLVSRLVLLLLGVSMSVEYNWQFFHDLDLLQHRLWETLLHTHAFTPFMALFVGLVLKVSEAHAPLIYEGTYLGLGLAFLFSIAYLLLALGLRRRTAFVLAIAFSLSPSFIYFEKLLHYEFPAAALLCVAAVLLHRALLKNGWKNWLLFFAACALIAYVRTTFHLVWMVGSLTLALIFNRASWRTIVLSALLPVLSVVALYAKNQALFGFFGSSSWFGFNLAIVTTERMTKEERQDWIDKGKLHPISAVSLYREPDAYAAWVDISKKTGIPVLDRTHRLNGEANYNHNSYLELSRLRMQDVKRYWAERRSDYVRTVLRGVIDYHRPSTRWHPHDDSGGSPHEGVRAVLGSWEKVYSALVHALPPLGLYLPAFVLIGFAVLRRLKQTWRAHMAHRARFQVSANDQLILWMLFNVAYVPAVSCLVTIGELERYRFMVEAFIWVLAIWAARTVLEPQRQKSTLLHGSKTYA